MMEGRTLFTDVVDEQGHYNAHTHLAQMVALFGPLPKIMLEQEKYFRTWAFTPAAQNPKGELCSNSFQYFGGPFFNDEGKT